MRVIVWLVRAFIFFTLFAFALNNQQPAVVHWFFGVQWSAPMVIIVLVAFGAGSAIGVLAMVPRWWLHWRLTRRPAPPAPAPARSDAAASILGIEHPPRDLL